MPTIMIDSISVEVFFADDDLDRLEVDPKFTARLSSALVKAYRKKMQVIRAATDERVLYGYRSLRFEALQGRRQGQFSIRLNDQYRLVFEFMQYNPDAKSKVVKVICIEDYH